MAEINTIIQLRNDTAEKWATEAGQATPLKPGEVAVEIVDGKAKLKIGTAEDSTFGNSAYFGSDVKEAQVYQSAPISSTGEQDDIVIIEGLIPEGVELQNGDIAIVKRYISGDSGAISYTSYVYDSSYADETSGNPGWAATDGNYSASNVFLNNKITLAGDYGKDSRNDAITSIGNLRIGDEIAAGTSLQSMLMNMLSQRLQPSATNPSGSIVNTTTNSNGANVSVEIGSTVTPKYKTTFNDGKFTYDEVTGCTSTAAVVEVENVSGTSASIEANAMNNATGSLPSYQVKDTTARYLKVTYGWTADTITPKDNLGDPCTNDAKIEAASGKTAKSSHYIQGFRNYWYGFISTTDTTGATIARVTDSTASNYNAVTDGTKTLIDGGAAVSSKTLPTITATAGDRMPVVLIPTGAKKVTSATMPSSLNAPVTFTKATNTIKIHGLNGFNEADYDLWYYLADDMPVGADFSIVLG